MQKLINDHIRELQKPFIKKGLCRFRFRNFVNVQQQIIYPYLTNDIQVYQEGSLRSKLLIAPKYNFSSDCSLRAVDDKCSGCCPGYWMYSHDLYGSAACLTEEFLLCRKSASEKLSFLTQTLNNNLEGFYVICTYCCQHKALKAFGAANADYNQSKKTVGQNCNKK